MWNVLAKDFTLNWKRSSEIYVQICSMHFYDLSFEIFEEHECVIIPPGVTHQLHLPLNILTTREAADSPKSNARKSFPDLWKSLNFIRLKIKNNWKDAKGVKRRHTLCQKILSRFFLLFHFLYFSKWERLKIISYLISSHQSIYAIWFIRLHISSLT